jgi:hypothetical protein
VSPAQHQIHHSVDPRHQGRNLGGVFAIWDWLAGTLYLPREQPELRFGLGDGEEAAYQSVARLYFVPFHRVAGRVARALELQRRRTMSLSHTTSLRMQRGALGLAFAAALLLSGDSQAGEERSANPRLFSIQQSSPVRGGTEAANTSSERQARLPVGVTDYGIVNMNGVVQMNGVIQMSGSPTPTARRAPGAGFDADCSCWDGIGACKRTGDKCVPYGGTGTECTGYCEVDEPTPASKRLARLQARYPGLYPRHEIVRMNGIAQMNGITDMNGLLERGEGLTTPARSSSSN